MYHIVKSKSKTKPVSIVQTAKNGEPTNFHPVKTLQAAFVNIISRLKDVESSDAAKPELYAYVQDERKKKIIFWRVYNTGQKLKIENAAASPRYIPGKNPKSKQ